MYLPQHARNITTSLFLVLSLSRIAAQAIPDTVACAPSTQTSTQLSLLFVGDFMQHVAQIEAAQTDSGYCYNDCWQYVRDEISRADIAVGNFETTLGGKPYSGYPSFSAPDEFFTSLVDAGFDIFLTSNNHSLDTGKRGIERTISQMNKVENIAQVGTYIDRTDRDKRYPYIFEKKRHKNSFIKLHIRYQRTYRNGTQHSQPYRHYHNSTRHCQSPGRLSRRYYSLHALGS